MFEKKKRYNLTAFHFSLLIFVLYQSWPLCESFSLSLSLIKMSPFSWGLCWA